MDPVTGSIIGSIGSSLIGGIFGRKKETPPPPPKWKPINYKKLRKAAKRGGINPLTALQLGGGQSGAWATEPAAMSSNSFIGEALAAGVQAWAEYDPLQEEKSRLENDLMQAELDRMNREATSPVQGFASGVMVAGAPSNTVTTGLTFGGTEIKTASDTSDAELYEQRYGDVGSAIIGLGIMGRDFIHNGMEAAKNWKAPTFGTTKAPALTYPDWFRPRGSSEGNEVPDYFAP